MNKILNHIFILFLFTLVSCAYEPIFKEKNYKFSINVNRSEGNQQVNSLIADKFNRISGDDQIYNINLTSKKEKNIISKDSKGDPSIFELIVSVKYTVTNNGDTIIEREVTRKNKYNNISDKFELEKNEKTILNNLSEGISDSILSSIFEINE